MVNKCIHMYYLGMFHLWRPESPLRSPCFMRSDKRQNLAVGEIKGKKKKRSQFAADWQGIAKWTWRRPNWAYLDDCGSCAARWSRGSFGKRAGRSRFGRTALSLPGREQSKLPWSADFHSAAVKRSANIYLSIPIWYLDVADEVSLTAERGTLTTVDVNTWL